jgi:hypothetical protein
MISVTVTNAADIDATHGEVLPPGGKIPVHQIILKEAPIEDTKKRHFVTTTAASTLCKLR